MENFSGLDLIAEQVTELSYPEALNEGLVEELDRLAAELASDSPSRNQGKKSTQRQDQAIKIDEVVPGKGVASSGVTGHVISEGCTASAAPPWKRISTSTVCYVGPKVQLES